MKAILLYSFYASLKCCFARRLFLPLIFAFFLFTNSFSQCGAGYYNCTVNWDNLDYLISTGTYSGYVSNAMSETQNFAIGINYVTIVRTSSITALGENTLHTGEAGSFATGADVEFDGDGTITLTFATEASNVRFSLYDIDRLQSVTVTAQNASAIAQTVTLTTPPGSILTITGSPGFSPNGSDPSPSTTVANTSNAGTLNVSVTGPVKIITIAISTSNSTKNFWLSDISACVFGAFANDYHSIMQPYTGQPTYILASSWNTLSAFKVNVATGVAEKLFTDEDNPGYPYVLNSLAYDPVKSDIYYIPEGAATPLTNKVLKKYNASTETVSTVLPDFTSLGIPAFRIGTEEAGAAFYDGWLFLGIEGLSNDSLLNENIIWRISFDASGNAVSACQVAGWWKGYANSNSIYHDWGDFAVVDSMIIDFSRGKNYNFTHYNMRTGNIDNSYIVSSSLQPDQAAVSWNDQVYSVWQTIAVYNGDGTLGPKTTITGPGWVGGARDATGFRPHSDFGDAPASYDPDPLSPALHEKDTALRLGPTFDQEFIKSSSAMADGDGGDEDGISTVNMLDTATFNYSNEVTVYNNTGANATLIAWLDIDGDGIFEPSEAVTATVPHGGPTLQTITLVWWAINTPLTAGQTTYLRVRLTRAASGMTTANATGYFDNGEVEDYIVYINAVLPVNLVSFNATSVDNKQVNLNWLAENETNLKGYEIQKSADGIQWKTIGFVNARNQSGLQEYGSWDLSPPQGRIQYRLRIAASDGNSRYSNIKTVMFYEKQLSMKIFPNPVNSELIVNIYSDKSSAVKIYVYDIRGNKIHVSKFNLTAGENHISLETEKFPSGVYIVTAETPGGIITEKFVKR